MSNSTREGAACGHGWLWWCWHLVVWATVAALLTVAVLRFVWHDEAELLIWLNAFTLYVYLPVYAGLAWALVWRRWYLAAVAGLVVLCHLVWIAPDFLRDRRFQPPATSAAAASSSPTIRIFYANVRSKNTEREALIHEIAQADPHIVVLVEYSWRWHVAVRESPLMKEYIHSLERYGPGQMNVLSKIPIVAQSVEWVGGRLVFQGDFQIGEHAFRLVSLHGPRPMKSTGFDYDRFWSTLQPRLLDIAASHRPLVVVGDFNATQHSRLLRELTAEHLRSAHEDRGRGYALTWPNGQHLVPPIRIDHALLSRQIECEQIIEGEGRGSDHKPLIFDVRIWPEPD